MTDASGDHYFSADPSAPFKREPFECEVWGRALTLVSGSGVFSRGHLDHATAILFRETEPPAPLTSDNDRPHTSHVNASRLKGTDGSALK